MNTYKLNNPTWLKSLIVGLFLLALMYISFKFCSEFSWVLIFFITFAYLIFLGLNVKSSTLKVLYYNTSAIFIALFLYESYLCASFFFKKDKKLIEESGSYVHNDYMAEHPYLGYGVRTDGVFTSKKKIEGKVLYDVSYTIKNRLRHTPNSNVNSKDCVLFFGCSFTFGEGLPDTSTLPFYFNDLVNRKFKVFNYGFHGYGPHQMLATIENRISKDMEGCKNEKIAIYSFIPFHVARAAGYSGWDQDGPMYEIVNGSLEKVIPFKNRIPHVLNEKIRLSHIYKKFFTNKLPSKHDLIRTIEIIKKSKEILAKKNIKMYVFIWNDDKSWLYSYFSLDYFTNEMLKSDIKTFLLTNSVADYSKNKKNYILSDDDKHPNALVNKKIANYLYLQLNDKTAY